MSELQLLKPQLDVPAIGHDPTEAEEVNAAIADSLADLISFSELKRRGLHGVAAAFARGRKATQRVNQLLSIAFARDGGAVDQALHSVDSYLAGDPVPGEVLAARLAESSAALHILAQTVDRAAEIIAANPGRIEHRHPPGQLQSGPRRHFHSAGQRPG